MSFVKKRVNNFFYKIKNVYRNDRKVPTNKFFDAKTSVIVCK